MESKKITVSKPIISKKIINDVNKILKSRNWVQGKTVEELEKKVAFYSSAKYAIAVSSGTAALHTLLSSLQFQKGDEVITTPFTFVGTVNAILLAGAKPVFADIQADDFNIDPKEIVKKITKKTKAILVVDLYGQPADYQEISKIAKKYKLSLLGDSAQSIGALYNGKPLTKYADAIIYSLYATKNIAGGEGGLIVTNNKTIDRFARAFRHQGQDPYSVKPYQYLMPGLNYRMTEIHAAIALGQFSQIEKVIKKRQQIAKKYSEKLKTIKGLILPEAHKYNTHVFHQYTIRITNEAVVNRDMLKQLLEEDNIMSGIYYPKPLHLIEHLKFLKYKKGSFPVTEKISKEVLSLPIHYYLTNNEQKKIIRLLKEIFNQ